MTKTIHNISDIDFLSLRCVSAYFGKVIYEPGGSCGPRVQPDVQLVVVDRGGAELELDGRQHALKMGQAYVLWPGGHEYFRFDQRKPTAHRWVAISVSADTGPIETLRQCCRFQAEETTAMRGVLRMGLRMQASGYDLRSAMMVQLGLAYFAGFIEQAVDSPVLGSASLPRPVTAALEAITRRLVEPLTLDDLAAAASVTPPHIVRLFRTHLHTTPMRLLWHRRVGRGAELLRDTGLSVSQIADRVGFASPFHFSRLFRDRFGQPPTRWRKQRWERFKQAS